MRLGRGFVGRRLEAVTGMGYRGGTTNRVHHAKGSSLYVEKDRQEVGGLQEKLETLEYGG